MNDILTITQVTTKNSQQKLSNKHMTIEITTYVHMHMNLFLQAFYFCSCKLQEKSHTCVTYGLSFCTKQKKNLKNLYIQVNLNKTTSSFSYANKYSYISLNMHKYHKHSKELLMDYHCQRCIKTYIHTYLRLSVCSFSYVQCPYVSTFVSNTKYTKYGMDLYLQKRTYK